MHGLLANTTGDVDYWNWYDQIWGYCWRHFADHEHGAWFRLLSEENERTSDRKSEAGSKCDYHNFGACLDALQVL